MRESSSISSSSAITLAQSSRTGLDRFDGDPPNGDESGGVIGHDRFLLSVVGVAKIDALSASMPSLAKNVRLHLGVDGNGLPARAPG